MADNNEMYAMPGQLLNDIGLAVKTQLDDMTDIPVEDIPMKIGMIGGGGVQAWGGEFTLSTNNHAITIPEGVFSKIAETNSLIHIYCDYASVDDTDTGYYVIDALILLSPNTRELEISYGWRSVSRTTAKKADGTIRTMQQQQTGSRYTAFRASSNAFIASNSLDFYQSGADKKSFYISTGNTTYKFKAGIKYKADWLYFGTDPENEIHEL